MYEALQHLLVSNIKKKGDHAEEERIKEAINIAKFCFDWIKDDPNWMLGEKNMNEYGYMIQ